MKKHALLVLIGALALPVALTYGAEQASTVSNNASPDATVQLDAGSVAAGIGYVWGHGKISFQGSEHPFSISGVSLADVGGAQISATGEVSHLANLADFAGNYTAFSAGLTVGGGGSATYLKNEHGVVIKLVATTAGLRVNLSANTVHVKLEG